MLQTIYVIDIVNKIIENLQAKTALELGTGTGGILAGLNVASKVGVDKFYPDLLTAANKFPSLALIKYDILKLEEILLPKSFDVVIGFDILEHFVEADAMQLISMAERIATKAVIFWGPLEPSLSLNPTPDNSGQEHLSLLNMDMFDKRNYEIIRFPYYWRIPRVDRNVDGILCFKCWR
jgi:hypothetical protein